MRNLRFHAALTLTVTGLLLQAASPVQAQTARSGGAPNAQLMQQMQQLASERTALQAENGRMKKELEDLRKERDQLKAGQKALGSKAQASVAAALARSNTAREEDQKEIGQLKGKMQELIAKFREVAESLRTSESEAAAGKQQLVSRDQDLKVCADRNAQLAKLNEEILAKLEKPSDTLSRLARAEPFTQLSRIRRENLVDDYRSRAADLRVDAPTPSSALSAHAP